MKRIAPAFAVVLLVVTITFGMAVSATPAETAVGIESGSAAPGETVEVGIWANASNVSSYQLNFTYDTAVVDVVAIEGADFDDPVTNVDEDEGWAMLTQTNVDGVDDPMLAVVTLRVREGAEPNATTEIGVRPADTELFDSESNTIPVDAIEDGELTVGEMKTTTTQQPTTASSTTPAETTRPPTTASSESETPGPSTEDSFGFGGLVAQASPVVLAGGAFVLGGVFFGGVFLVVSRLR